MDSHRWGTDDPQFGCHTTTTCYSHESGRALLLVWAGSGWVAYTAAISWPPPRSWLASGGLGSPGVSPHLPEGGLARSYGGGPGPRDMAMRFRVCAPVTCSLSLARVDPWGRHSFRGTDEGQVQRL